MTIKTRWALIFALIAGIGLFALAVLGIAFRVFVFPVSSAIDAAEWKEVTDKEHGFQALMPGAPRLEQQNKETPVGKIELRKFSVYPKDKKELFMVVSLHFPEGVGHRLGGREKLLELGRQDILTASQGQVKTERRFTLNGCPGVEMEVLPPKGAIIRAQVLATEDQVYEVSVHLPQVRLASGDVQKFFDSFRVTAQAGAVADHHGE